MKKLLIITFLFCVACEKEINQTPKYEGDKLVVFGFLAPNEIVSVKVINSYPAFGDLLFNDGIENALVDLFENRIFIERLKYQKSGIYVSQNKFRPKVGQSYSIKIKASGFPEIESTEEVIPKDVLVKTIDFSQKITSIINVSFPSRKLLLQFDDIKGEDNYYQILVDGLYKKKKNAIITYELDKPSEIESVCGFKSKLSGTYNLTDFCFKDETNTFLAGVETRGSVQPGGQTADSDEIFLRIRTISKSFYEYNRTEYNEEGLLQAFKQPYPRYSNIKGGFGIFATYNEYNLNILKQ